jgi:hypothetical protein
MKVRGLGDQSDRLSIEFGTRTQDIALPALLAASQPATLSVDSILPAVSYHSPLSLSSRSDQPLFVVQGDTTALRVTVFTREWAPGSIPTKPQFHIGPRPMRVNPRHKWSPQDLMVS